MSLLPDTLNCWLGMHQERQERFTMGQQLRHASQHVHNTRTVMHAGIVK